MAGKKSKHGEQQQDMLEPILDPDLFSKIMKYNTAAIPAVVAAALAGWLWRVTCPQPPADRREMKEHYGTQIN